MMNVVSGGIRYEHRVELAQKIKINYNTKSINSHLSWNRFLNQHFRWTCRADSRRILQMSKTHSHTDTHRERERERFRANHALREQNSMFILIFMSARFVVNVGRRAFIRSNIYRYYSHAEDNRDSQQKPTKSETSVRLNKHHFIPVFHLRIECHIFLRSISYFAGIQ